MEPLELIKSRLASTDRIERVSRATDTEVLNVYFSATGGVPVCTLQIDVEAETAFMIGSRCAPSCNWEHDVAALNRALAIVIALGYRTELEA